MGCEVAPARDGFLEDSGSLTGADTLGCNLITDVNQTLHKLCRPTAANATRKGPTKGLPTLVPVSLWFTLKRNIRVTLK